MCLCVCVFECVCLCVKERETHGVGRWKDGGEVGGGERDTTRQGFVNQAGVNARGLMTGLCASKLFLRC